MKHFGDVTKINGAEVPTVDVVTGGSPCQDLSVAGKRLGLEGERSGLFMEQIRIIKEMREKDVRSGVIKGLELQKTYKLCKGRWNNGRPFSISYKADFVYTLDGDIIVEDVKGFRTEAYQLKKKLMKAFRDSHGDVSRFEMTPGPEYHSVLYMSAIATKPPHGENWYRRVI